MPQDPKKKKMKPRMAATLQKTVMTYDKDGKPVKKKKYPAKEMKTKKISRRNFYKNTYKKDKDAYKKEQREGGPTF